MRFFKKVVLKNKYQNRIKLLCEHVVSAEKAALAAKFGDPFYNNKINHLRELQKILIAYREDVQKLYNIKGVSP